MAADTSSEHEGGRAEGSAEPGARDARVDPGAAPLGPGGGPLPGVAEAPLGLVDPVVMVRSLNRALLSSLRRPVGLAGVGARLGLRSGAATLAAAGRVVGIEREGPARSFTDDGRYADRAFAENALYFWLAQQHGLAADALGEVLDLSRAPAETQAKARFAARFLGDAFAPTNTVVGNPEVVRRAFDTGGKSLVRGARHFVHDVRRNRGWPSQVDGSGFTLGTNMAATSGKVVHRGPLVEVLQYDAQTEQVHEVPLLFCPPWINKYYLMDLAPGRSLIEWAVQHGHTCFAISYRNPDRSMRDLGFEDYLQQGLLEALQVVRDITGAPRANTVSACLGGTLTSLLLAWCAQTGEDLVNTATLLNTHTDFSDSGTLGVFVDDAAVAALEKRMARTGYLDAKEMAHTFDALRANDLIFRYAVTGWLLGERPPSFDLLVWNADSTRMPERMHSQYLRSCYLENRFARGEFELDGYKLDPGAVQAEAYVVGAIGDHIVPWGSAHTTSLLLGGRNRFVLSSSGHIAGIVNPPSPKARYWTNDAAGRADADTWFGGARQHKETWWEDWARWIAERAGPLGPAPTSVGSDDHPPLEDAPGTYVSLVPK